MGPARPKAKPLQQATIPAPPSKGQQVAYIRVSSTDQNTARQLDGLTFDRTFTDTVSGKNTDRPAFGDLMKFVRAGDTVTVHSMDRLARNLGDLRSVVLDLTGRGVQVRFVKENLTFTGDDSAMSMLLLNVMGAFAEFERALIRERQREGIQAAKEKGGVYKGRKPSLTAVQVVELRRRAAAGEPKARLAREFGVSRETVYRYLPDAEHRSWADPDRERRVSGHSDSVDASAKSERG